MSLARLLEQATPEAAEELVRLPFGSLDQRDFYRVREAVRDAKGDTT